MAHPKPKDMKDDTVTIPRTKYIGLLRDREKLQALEGAGVDNWEGYDIAMEGVFVDDPN